MAIQALNITKSGTGSGTVTSDVGIPPVDCGDTCSVAQTSGTNVTLTAAPNRGSRFVKWSGDVNSEANPVTYLQAVNPTNINAEFRKKRNRFIGAVSPFIFFSTDLFFLPDVPIEGTIPGQTRSIITPQINYRGTIYNYDVVIEHNFKKYYRYKIAVGNARNLVGLGSVDTSVKK